MQFKNKFRKNCFLADVHNFLLFVRTLKRLRRFISISNIIVGNILRIRRRKTPKNSVFKAASRGASKVVLAPSARLGPLKGGGAANRVERRANEEALLAYHTLPGRATLSAQDSALPDKGITEGWWSIGLWPPAVSSPTRDLFLLQQPRDGHFRSDSPRPIPTPLSLPQSNLVFHEDPAAHVAVAIALQLRD